MPLSTPTKPLAVLIPLLALAGHGEAAPGALELAAGPKSVLVTELSAVDTPRGCSINVKATNQGSKTTAISRDSQVKMRTGTWKKLDKSVWIAPGKTVSWTYTLDFGCNNDRTYRYLVKQFDSNNNLLGENWKYQPGRYRVNGTWRYSYTRDISLNLGDLGSLF